MKNVEPNNPDGMATKVKAMASDVRAAKYRRNKPNTGGAHLFNHGDTGIRLGIEDDHDFVRHRQHRAQDAQIHGLVAHWQQDRVRTTLSFMREIGPISDCSKDFMNVGRLEQAEAVRP